MLERVRVRVCVCVVLQSPRQGSTFTGFAYSALLREPLGVFLFLSRFFVSVACANARLSLRKPLVSLFQVANGRGLPLGKPLRCLSAVVYPQELS